MGPFAFNRHRREMMRASGFVMRSGLRRERLTLEGWIGLLLFMLFALAIAAALFFFIHPLVYNE